MSKKRKLDDSYQFILDHIDEYAAENKLLGVENDDLWNTNMENKTEIQELTDEKNELSEDLDDKKHEIRNLKFRISALEDLIEELNPDFEVGDVDVWTS